MDKRAFTTLTEYLQKIPAIDLSIATGVDEEGFWWVKFKIDIHHNLAWQPIL